MKQKETDTKTITLAGNPNVGKSTFFNTLTGLKQHTGNWTGKTVDTAKGYFKSDKNSYTLVDVPGTYSLFSHSEEEEIARDYIIFGEDYKTVIICDAVSLERNLALVLQILEIKKNIVVCVNLIDEAKKKGTYIDCEYLSKALNCPVIPIIARKKSTLKPFLDELDRNQKVSDFKIEYFEPLERVLNDLENEISTYTNDKKTARFIALCLLKDEKSLIKKFGKRLGFDFENTFKEKLEKAKKELISQGITENKIYPLIANRIITKAEEIAKNCVKKTKTAYSDFDSKLDRIITDKRVSFLLFSLLLAITFWITVKGANYLSAYLSSAFSFLENNILKLLSYFNASNFLKNVIIEGIFRVPFWVISVMLPPMAIFFPLFTLLEDSGLLPRIAFCLDKPFKKCKSCGKQSLTMCMGFGCNAVGVTGARIIDSKREKLLSIITNSLVPCNGRFPTLITLISIFVVTAKGFAGEILSAFSLSLLIILCIVVTLIATKLLSHTLLKGEQSAYTLELPSYRKPQFLKVITRSFLDRTLFVLGRALVVAVPCGIVIFILNNITYNSEPVLYILSRFLEPIGRLLGLDGVILLGFILGFPANEIVLPIILMCYLKNGALTEISDLSSIREILLLNGWTLKTGICTLAFCLFHFPCSTTLLTIKKETGSMKWTFVSFALPTLIGAAICFVINLVF